MGLSLWLLISPITAVVAPFVDPYVREKASVVMECMGQSYGCGLLLWVLWPGRIHDYFNSLTHTGWNLTSLTP